MKSELTDSNDCFQKCTSQATLKECVRLSVPVHRVSGCWSLRTYVHAIPAGQSANDYRHPGPPHCADDNTRQWQKPKTASRLPPGIRIPIRSWFGALARVGGQHRPEHCNDSIGW